MYISTRNSKPHPRMSHRSDKGWTDIYLFLFRDGPSEIIGGRVKNVWCLNFLKKPACLQEFFFQGIWLIAFRYHRLQDFFRQVSLAEIFLGGIVTPPSVISNGPSLIRRSTDCDHDDLTSIDPIRIRYLWTDIICIWSAISVYTTVYSC